MATKKQQKRRRKIRVHGAPERAMTDTPRPARTPAAKAAKVDTRKASPRRRTAATARQRRPVPEPSWSRSIKLSVGMMALMAVFIYFFGPSKQRGPALLVYAVGLGILYIPANYYIMRLAYRRAERMTQSR
jgi:hypothetical protein